MSVVFLLSLLSIQDDPQEISRLLEFQYEQKLSSLTTENSNLRKQIESLQKKTKTCEPGQEMITEQPRAKTNFDPETKVKAQEEKSLYKEALKAIQREDWDEALLRMEHFVRYFESSELADNAVYWMAEIYIRKNETNLAREELTRILRDFPKGDRVSRAQKLLDQMNGGHP